MLTFLARRTLLLIPILFGVSIITFLMIHLVPGDPVQIMLGHAPSGTDVAALRHQLGLDQALPVQYGNYVVNALHGNLGTSIRSGRPVVAEIGDRFPATLQLTLTAMVIAVILGVGIGTLAATSRSRFIDNLLMLIATMGVSLPTFWLGLLLIYFFALQLGWFPVLSDTSLRGLVLPAITLALPGAAVLARVTRASLVDVLHQDYIRTARAKGLTRSRVVWRHALRNGLIVVLTIAGLQFGGLMAGSVIVETVFGRTGLGSFVVNAIQARDYPDIQGVVLVIASFYVVINLIIDVLYGLINPRIRVS
ncbi:MAG: ABC-type dipeptide/oligopeptide/nickel transport system, permease component [Chloroflexi bacterium]|nr:ABC-type dipeptide/oligopeptide/nickel transport system, permease component [Chloroflexota bacterium]